MIVDLVVVAFLGLFVWRGLRRGLVLSLTGFVGFFVAAAAAVFGYRPVAPTLASVLGVSAGVANIAAALTIFVALTAGFAFAGRALTKLLRLTKWGMVNAAGGGALSGLWAMSWVTAILLSLSVIPVSKTMESQIASSALASAVVEQAPGWLSTVARTDLREMLRAFLPEERPVAIAATADFRRLPAAERQLFDLLNVERRAHDLPLLVWDEALARAARAHSADMYRRGYFAHDTPEGASPGERLERARVPYSVTGENLALAPTVRIAHNRLMGSRRHRRHILGARFVRVGIGAIFGRQGLLITQEFAG